MPLLLFLLFFASLFSFGILIGGGYLLWSWYDGREIINSAGVLIEVRDDWRLWTGLALLASAVFGRFLVLMLLARPDKDPLRLERGEGRKIEGIDGDALFVEVLGRPDGPTIVFTHGWALDSTIWAYAKKALAVKYRLIFWDLPGLGKSTAAGRQSQDLERMAANLGRVIALAEGKPVLLVGHSIGGMIIQTLAKENAEMFRRDVAGVVLLNTTYTNPLETMVLGKLFEALRRPLIEPLLHLTIALRYFAQINAWGSYLSGASHCANRLGFGPGVTRSQLEATTLLATRNRQDVLARGNLAMFRWNASSAFAKLSVPTLVIAGDVDLVTKAKASSVIAKSIPSATLNVIKRANHMGFLEQAPAYNSAIADFAGNVFAGPALATDARQPDFKGLVARG